MLNSGQNSTEQERGLGKFRDDFRYHIRAQELLLSFTLEEIWKPNIPWNVHVCGCVVMLVLKSELVASNFMIFKAIRAFHLDIFFTCYSCDC